jgi:inosine-uridine nucleoside N-ribohydrolase
MSSAQSVVTPRRVIIDTDPGIDDALALILALRSPELRVEAVTTVNGNVELESATRNALRVLEVLDPAEPPIVARGAKQPLAREPLAARHVHGEDGLGDIGGLTNTAGDARYPEPSLSPDPASAVEVILGLLRARPGEISIVALGPLTNIALALEANPAVFAEVKEVIVMGGSLSGIGNVTATAEFNFYADPHAASQLMRSRVPVTIVGLDVTWRTLLLETDLEARLKGRSGRVAEFIKDISGKYFEVNLKRRGLRGCPLHDPLTVGVAIDPSFVTAERVHADVETEGRLTTGMLVADRREGVRRAGREQAIQAAVDVDAERFVNFFLERVLP